MPVKPIRKGIKTRGKNLGYQRAKATLIKAKKDPLAKGVTRKPKKK